ncbi:hypothetical protein C8P64_2498 [Christiangramia gaetbulicola]|uniref:Carboxypeptidase-like protein n=1 Tax=Christiangramia gaetbulicola TaxID=703340 RepID=A0A2T6AE79_9FLAO|nr:carboxypeptidase-like regulatory domain-containing protein [Christiangramia gaetbulicola]PTX42082.1 hypothetical protein C8P64_2498 [Christiangramia gaetbulicola]
MILKNYSGLWPFFLLLFFAEYDMYSQQTTLLEGQIVSDSISTSNIHVVNLNLEKGTTSDTSGKFRIYSRSGDTLLFSSVQFEKRKVVVTQADIDARSLSVKLFPSRNELDEVRISDLKLSGYLDSDLPRIKYFDRQQYGIPYPEKRPSQTERRLYTANSNITSRWQYIGVLLGGVPLDVIMNDINGRTKYLKALDKQDKLQLRVQNEIDVLGKEFFKNELGLPENEIENFVYYCAEFPGFEKLLKTANRLGIIEHYKSRRQDFIDLRQINDIIEK